MLTTKRYDYVLFDQIRVHPSISNHRPLNMRKVEHYTGDILKNGLLEPLVVWERNPGEFFLVGGFHRLNAIKAIRDRHPGYFERVDVRVVDGDLDEMQALNVKLNADRMDIRITDYFDAVILLKNANWSAERIAEFLDKPQATIDDIIRFVPGMDPRVRAMLEEGRLSWTKARAIGQAALRAEPGQEKAALEAALAAVDTGETASRRPLTWRRATSRLARQVKKDGKNPYTVTAADLLALLMVVKGRAYEEEHLTRVRRAFPALLD